MVGEGHAFDMIRRIKEGREASRLRRERANDKLKHLNRANEPYPLPNTTPEEMERIIHDSEKKKEKDSNYFVWGTLIIMGVLIAIAVILWAVWELIDGKRNVREIIEKLADHFQNEEGYESRVSAYLSQMQKDGFIKLVIPVA